MPLRDPITENLRRRLNPFGNIGTPTFTGQPIGTYGSAGQDMYGGILNQPTPMPQPVQQDGSDPISRMRAIFSSGTPGLDRYKEHMSGMPTRTDPGWKNKLGAGIVGALSVAGGERPLAGLGVAKQILEEPYQRSMETWTNKGAALKEMADIEEADRKYKIAGLEAELEHEIKQQDQFRKDLETGGRLERYESQNEYYGRTLPEKWESDRLARQREFEARNKTSGERNRIYGELGRERNRIATERNKITKEGNELRAKSRGANRGPTQTQRMTAERQALQHLASDPDVGQYISNLSGGQPRIADYITDNKGNRVPMPPDIRSMVEGMLQNEVGRRLGTMGDIVLDPDDLEDEEEEDEWELFER